MNELETLKYKHEFLTLQIDTLKSTRDEVRQAIAEINCPFKPGDRIINKKGERAEVAAIGHWSNLRYKIKIKKIRKDGQLFANEITAWESDQWKLDQ